MYIYFIVYMCMHAILYMYIGFTPCEGGASPERFSAHRGQRKLTKRYIYHVYIYPYIYI